MTQEQKDIILHGAAFEMMNTCINFDDGTVDREKMLKAMHRYADMYHKNEISKLRQDAVISQRELLLDFAEYSENDQTSTTFDECVDNYLDSIKQ